MKINETATVSRVINFDNQLRSFFDKYHKDIIESKNKALGQIYSEADLQKLIKELRPKFVYNFFVPILLGLIGNLKNNLPRVEVIPVTENDLRNVNLQQKLLDYYLYTANDIDYELAKAYLFALIMKIGWITVDYGYDNNPDGMVEIKFANPLQIKFDPNWSRKDCKDMKYLTSYAWMTPEEIVQKYAYRDEELAEELFEKMNEIIGYSPDIRKGKVTSWTTRLFGNDKSYYKEKGYDTYDFELENSYYRNGLFKVIDHYEKLAVPTMRVYDVATGQSEDITDKVIKDNYEIDPSTTLKDWYDNDKLQRQRSKYVEPIITTGYNEQIFMFSVIPQIHKQLYGNKLKVQKSGMFKHIPVFALDIGIDATETMSIIDIVSDPVTSYNLRRNTILTYLMKMSNKGYIAEDWAVDGYQDMFKDKRIGGLKTVKAGALTKGAIEEEKLPQYPEALARYSENDKEDLFTLSTVTPNYMGKQESANESGVLYKSRVERSDIMQTWLLDNVKNTLVLVSKQCIATGQRFIKAERTIRILSEDNQPEWLVVNKTVLGEIINDVGTGLYDTAIAKSPSGKTAREQEFEKLISLSQWIAQMFGSQFIDLREIIKASNLFNKDALLKHVDKVMGIEEKAAAMENIINFMKEYQTIAQNKLQQKQLAMQIQQLTPDPASKYIDMLKQNNLLQQIGA